MKKSIRFQGCPTYVAMVVELATERKCTCSTGPVENSEAVVDVNADDDTAELMEKEFGKPSRCFQWLKEDEGDLALACREAARLQLGAVYHEGGGYEETCGGCPGYEAYNSQDGCCYHCGWMSPPRPATVCVWGPRSVIEAWQNSWAVLPR